MLSWDEIRAAALVRQGYAAPVAAPAPALVVPVVAPAAPPERNLKVWQAARNGLRTYLKVYAGDLTVMPEEIAPLSGKGLEAAARKMEKSMDGEAPVPMEAHRPAQANPYPWMRPANKKPQRSKHAKGK
jgi:hypothetical protein